MLVDEVKIWGNFSFCEEFLIFFIPELKQVFANDLWYQSASIYCETFSHTHSSNNFFDQKKILKQKMISTSQDDCQKPSLESWTDRIPFHHRNEAAAVVTG